MTSGPVSRQEELDKLPEDALAAWSDVFVLSETAQGEAEDGPTAAAGDSAATGGDSREGDDTSAARAEARPSGLRTPR